MKCILPLLLFVAASAYGKVVVVNSDNAEYDGAKIALHGSVVVNHPVGVLAADEVVMKPKAGIDDELASVELHDNVALRLTEGGHLSCSQAYVDLIKSSAQCRDNVVYTEHVEGKQGEKIPVIMKCKMLSLAFDGGEDKAQLKDRVHEITALDQVTISYNHDFIASGNKAVYHRLPAEPTVDFPGTISLTSDEGSGSCLVTNLSGDMLYASAIGIDTRDQCLALENPRGTMLNADSNEWTVRSDVATWQENRGILTLTGHVEIHDPTMGVLQTNNEVRLISSGKKWVRAEAEGESTLTYKAPNVKTLKCYGLCILDHEKMEARLLSPKDEDGRPLLDQQVHYTDEKGEFYADRAFLKYTVEGKETKPVLITLSGNVKILNRIGDREKQFILADNVEYNPATQLMILKATKGRRVLLYDDENEIQMSAQGAKIIRDAITKKDAIEGIGDVRFHLADFELTKLEQQFSLGKITSKLIKKQ